MEQSGRAVVRAGGRTLRSYGLEHVGWPRGRRGRLAGLVAQAGAVPGRRPSCAHLWPARPVRRAALPLQLQLPGRRESPGGAGRAGGAPGPGRAGTHRPRRHVRGGPVRRGRRRARGPHGLRRGAVARAHRSAERGGRSRGQPPAPARARPRRVPGAVPHDQHRPARRQGEGPPGLRPRGGRRRHGRARARAHRMPQGRGAPGAAVAVGAPPRPSRSVAWSSGSGRTTSPSNSPTRRCPPTPRSTTPWPGSPPTRGCRRSPPPPRTTPRPSGSRWPRRWRRFAPGAAWTRPTAGCRPRVPRTCARARRWPPGSTPAIPARWRGRRGSARSARSRSISSPRTCPRSRPRRASRRRSGCASSPAAESCSATAATTSTPKRSPPWSGSWRSSRTGSSPATS